MASPNRRILGSTNAGAVTLHTRHQAHRLMTRSGQMAFKVSGRLEGCLMAEILPKHRTCDWA